MFRIFSEFRNNRNVFILLNLSFLIGLSNFASAKASEDPIKFFSWHEYLSPEVERDLKIKHGYNLETTTYLTNDMAASRLIHNREKFEVAIISNVVYDMLLKHGVLQKNLFKGMKRDYLEIFRNVKDNCTPFFWLVSGYLYDAKVLKTGPNSIESLLKLAKDKSVFVSVVDDAIEVGYRVMGDHSRRIEDLDIYPKDLWKNVRFISDIWRSSPYKRIAVFTWHGVATDHLFANQELEFSLPAKNLLVGYDLVCIVSKDQKRIPRLKRFVEFLTVSENTERNIKYNQYFSPYRDAKQKSLHPKIKKIYDASLKKIKSKNYVETKMMQDEDLKRLNEWWRTRRYGE